MQDGHGNLPVNDSLQEFDYELTISGKMRAINKDVGTAMIVDSISIAAAFLRFQPQIRCRVRVSSGIVLPSDEDLGTKF